MADFSAPVSGDGDLAFITAAPSAISVAWMSDAGWEFARQLPGTTASTKSATSRYGSKWVAYAGSA